MRTASDRDAAREQKISSVHWWPLLGNVYQGIVGDRIVSTAAGVSFFVLLAIFPGLAGAISLYGLIADSHMVSQHIKLLTGVLPEGGLQILQEQLDHLTSQPAPRLGLATFVSLLFSLWSANSGVKALIDALNVVYEEREARGLIRLNLTSLALTLGAMGLVTATLLSITVLPGILAWIGEADTGEALRILRWPILLVLVNIAIGTLYWLGPSRPGGRWRWISPGSVFATLTWLGASLLFSWYTEHFGGYNKTYGSMGAVVGFMTWLWLSTIVVLVGARLNAELERQTTSDAKAQPEAAQNA